MQLLIAGVDVQKTELKYVLTGWSHGEQSWLIRSGRVQSWEEFRALFVEGSWGQQQMPVSLVCIDARHRSDEVLDVVRSYPDICRPVIGIEESKPGALPIAKVESMATALHEHETASLLLNGRGFNEVTVGIRGLGEGAARLLGARPFENTAEALRASIRSIRSEIEQLQDLQQNRPDIFEAVDGTNRLTEANRQLAEAQRLLVVEGEFLTASLRAQRAAQEELAAIRQRERAALESGTVSSSAEGKTGLNLDAALRSFRIASAAGQKYKTVVNAIRQSTKDVNDDTTELGFTFQSAFEDAIVEGRKLRDVMRGLLQDILRILLRTSITQPFGNFFAGLFTGRKIPVKDSGGTFSGPFISKRPELIIPNGSGRVKPTLAGIGGMTLAPTIHFNLSGVSASDAEARLRPFGNEIVAQVVATIRDLDSRGEMFQR